MILKQQLYKKKYSLLEGYRILVEGFQTIKYMKKAKRENLLSEAFIKRLMLAVTEVNGCEVCSYSHTKSALEMGMSQADIHKMLTAQTEIYPEDESEAVFFAQHYADSKGHPTQSAWMTIEKVYGREKALGILGAIRVIMVGNSFGIPFSALKRRLKGHKIEHSTLSYEVMMLLSLIFMIPLSLIHALIRQILDKPLTNFKQLSV